MRECQLCGAKSWGPFLRRRNDYPITTTPENELVQCDACDSVARRDIVEKPVSVPELRLGELPHIADAIFGSPGVSHSPDPMTVAKEALESMRDRMPEPQTRLERIVRALIGQFEPAGWADYPADVVSTARKIEREMDKTNIDAEIEAEEKRNKGGKS